MTFVPTSLKGLLNGRWRRYSDSMAAFVFLILFAIAQRVYFPLCNRDECCTRRGADVDSPAHVLSCFFVSTACAIAKGSMKITNYKTKRTARFDTRRHKRIDLL